MILPTQMICVTVRVIGRSWVEVMNIINFIKVLGKRTLYFTVQSYMLNKTTNFTGGTGTRIHSINIHSA